MNSKTAKRLRKVAREIEEDPKVEHFFQPRDKTVHKGDETVTYRSLQLRLKPRCQKALYKRAKALYQGTSSTPDQKSI